MQYTSYLKMRQPYPIISILIINDTMNHSIYKILLMMISIIVLGTSCMKEDSGIDLTSRDWRVEKIRNDGQLTYITTDSTYILQFHSDTEYNLNLDVNMCMGLYEVPDQGNIEIQPMACTKVCCDTEFAEELAFLLPKMTRYYARSDVLYLEGDGKIVLQPY